MLRFLVVEDEFLSREYLCTFLRGHGVCDTARDGADGIERILRAVRDGAAYDLVFLDLMMPKVGGFEVYRAVAEAAAGSRTTFVFATALADRSVVATAKALGNDIFLFKPFTKRDVEKVLEAYAPVGRS